MSYFSAVMEYASEILIRLYLFTHIRNSHVNYMDMERHLNRIISILD
jgi:hypothetical protein